jgi:hypothetical protein
MSQVVRTSLACPRCGHAFQAIIEQIIDVGSDPQAKARFLSGHVNIVTCPNCGHMLAVGTPFLYHDPDKDLLLIHVPMELNISTEERERVIGDLTRRLTDRIPPEKRKGYLLQPRQALTVPGMIDMILDADGITAEMREAQREKMRVMEMFLQVSPDQWPALAEEQQAHLDIEFIQMIAATAENASETGHGPMAEGLVGLYNWMLGNTDAGQALVQTARDQEDIVREVTQELEQLGQQITREKFTDLVLRYADDEQRIQALVGFMRPAFDYQFFQELTGIIERASGEEQEQLADLRERLLELTSIIDQQTEMVMQRAVDTLRVILASEDIDAAIRPRLDMIDDTFLAVLQANIQNAVQRKDSATAERLQLVMQKVLEILRENAPPQIRLINDMLSTDNDNEAHALIAEQAPQFGPELLELMDAIAADMDANEQGVSAERLRTLRAVAAGHVGNHPQMPPVPPQEQLHRK